MLQVRLILLTRLGMLTCLPALKLCDWLIGSPDVNLWCYFFPSFSYYFPPPGIWGPHLVVVRTCKLLNWDMEFKRWCPGLKTLLYLGSKKERRYKRSVSDKTASFSHTRVASWPKLQSCLPYLFAVVVRAQRLPRMPYVV